MFVHEDGLEAAGRTDAADPEPPAERGHSEAIPSRQRSAGGAMFRARVAELPRNGARAEDATVRAVGADVAEVGADVVGATVWFTWGSPDRRSRTTTNTATAAAHDAARIRRGPSAFTETMEDGCGSQPVLPGSGTVDAGYPGWVHRLMGLSPTANAQDRPDTAAARRPARFRRKPKIPLPRGRSGPWPRGSARSAGGRWKPDS
jgi:hypothetical protein